MQAFAQVPHVKDFENYPVHLTPIQVFQSLGLMPLAMGTITWYVEYIPLPQNKLSNTPWSRAYSIVTAMDSHVTLADLFIASDLEDYRIVSMTVFQGWVNGPVTLEWLLNQPDWNNQLRSKYPNVTIECFTDLDTIRDTPSESGTEAGN